MTSTVVGNNEQGVVLDGQGTKANTVAGDWIGTNATSSIALSNGVGVVIEGGATANTIGGTTAGGATSSRATAGMASTSATLSTSSVAPSPKDP